MVRHMKAGAATKCQVVSRGSQAGAEWWRAPLIPLIAEHTLYLLPQHLPALVLPTIAHLPSTYCLDTLAATYRLGANAKATVVSVRSPVCDCDGLWRSRNAVASTRPSHALELVYTHF